MIISPLKPQKTRPVALIVPGWRSVRVISDRGDESAHGPTRVWQLLKSIEHHVTYVPSNLKSLAHSTGATHWTVDVWRGRASTMRLDGTTLKVSSLRRTLPAELDAVDQYETLMEVIDWLSDQGVAPGSVSSMAYRLWRSTLSAPLEIGFDPKVSRRALFGGRKGAAAPMHYRDQVSVDISRAYPSSMNARPYGGLMREVSKETRIDPEVAGLAEISAFVPDELAFPTLPVRLGPSMIQWRHGEIQGVYTWGEIAAAASLGCRVDVRRVWAPATEIDPFAKWWRLMQSSIEILPAHSHVLAKALSNMVWSSFAMTANDTESIRWSDDYAEHATRVARAPRRMPQANTVHLAAETSSRVRVRMLLEGLYGDREAPIHLDTDGMIVSAASAKRRAKGTKLGDWREKIVMDSVDLRAPQLYRYDCGRRCGDDHSHYHYVAAGTPSRDAAKLFDEHPGFQVSFSGIDSVVASASTLTPEQIRRYENASDDVQRLVYGPLLVAS